MKKKNFIIPILLLIVLCLNNTVYPCTTFCLKANKDIIFGRNLDFFIGLGYVTINKRNVTKTAFVVPPEKPLTWTSKYGSITFNQIGREFPYGGMNEAGLVVEQMWLEKTKYPEPDNRYGLSELQWIQYQLDNSVTTNDVIASDSLVRVSFQSRAPLHFLVCDKHGDIATIEYIDGKFVCHKGKNLPVAVLTNSTYDESIDYVSRFVGFGGSDTIQKTMSSLDRFARAANRVKNYDPKEPENIIDYSFNILKTVSQGEATQWSIVYDIVNMKIYFKTFKNRNRRVINFKDFNYSCALPVLVADIDDNFNNRDKAFIEYNTKLNRDLIENVFNNVPFLRNTPNDVRDLIARYPESVICNNNMGSELDE